MNAREATAGTRPPGVGRIGSRRRFAGQPDGHRQGMCGLRGARLAVLACVVTGAVAISGCGGSQVPEGARVLVLGDSIAAMSRDRITTVLSRRGWSPTVVAVSGTDIAFWRRRAAAFSRAVQPQAVVVELGTNQRGGEQRVAPLVDAVMHDLRHVPTVIWLNVQEGKRVAGLAVPPDAPGVNRALTDSELRWANLRVLDFDGYFSNRSAWHSADGLHPSDRGQTAIARFIARALPVAGRTEVPSDSSASD